MLKFGEKLKELRTNKKLSQKDLSKILNVSNTIISSYELSLRMPSYDILVKIARYFNVSTDYLLGIKNDNILNIGNLTNKQKLAIRQLIDSMED